LGASSYFRKRRIKGYKAKARPGLPSALETKLDYRLMAQVNPIEVAKRGNSIDSTWRLRRFSK
jgi:hypothetical protein